jgi:alpha-methylacyl-CoA racemase
MQPLSGVHIVSTAINVPGPVAAARLCAMGARVTKVEPPSGDPLKPFSAEWYASLTRGQMVVALDLKAADDRRRFHDLLRTADVLLTATRPAALARLGLPWDILHAQFPRLCHVGIIGYPPPDDNEAGHDLTYQARLGLVRPPQMPVTLLADLAGAERAVTMALALLLHRGQTGEAGQAWVSLADAARPFADPVKYKVTTPGSVLGGGLPGYRLYQTADGFIAVGALEAHFLQRLEEALGAAGAGHEDLEAAFLARTAQEWESWGRQHDIPVAAVIASTGSTSVD